MFKPIPNKVLASEAARILGCSSSRIRQLVDSGKLRASRGPLGIRLIDRLAVEKLVRQRTEKASDR